MTEPVPLKRNSAPEETPLERIKRLEAEVREAAQAERRVVLDLALETAGRCLALADVKSLGAGEVDALRKLAAAIESGVQTIQSIGARA